MAHAPCFPEPDLQAKMTNSNLHRSCLWLRALSWIIETTISTCLLVERQRFSPIAPSRVHIAYFAEANRTNSAEVGKIFISRAKEYPTSEESLFLLTVRCNSNGQAQVYFYPKKSISPAAAVQQKS